MKQSDIIKWYSRQEVGLGIVKSAENKEVAVRLVSGNFGKRPNQSLLGFVHVCGLCGGLNTFWEILFGRVVE